MTEQPHSSIDHALAHNARFASGFPHGALSAPPQKKLLVIACMDARINLEQALGLDYGDAHILRNAGGSVTDDVVRSAIVSTNVLGTREIMVINHTRCGMMTATDEDLKRSLTEQYGQPGCCPEVFHTFDDLNSHVREQVGILRGHPWLPEGTVIRGFTYDVETGQLHEVDAV